MFARIVICKRSLYIFFQRIQLITASLQDQLEGRLSYGLDLCHEAQAQSGGGGGGVGSAAKLKSDAAAKKASAVIRQVLSTYLSIDKLADAVSLYRKHVLYPQLSKVSQLSCWETHY